MHSTDQIRELFDAYASAISWQKAPNNLYAPISYVMEKRGKRMRPLFAMLATHLFNDQVNNAIPMAYAIELFHNFTLVHDDMMDEADLRRGKETVHHRFGSNRALLSGDVMLVYVYQFLHSYKESMYFGDLLETFTQAAIHVCEGQQMDMDFEARHKVAEDEYLKMIEYKTAVLFAAGLKMGGMIGGADPEDQERLYQFGRKLGIAFQIQDDWLDLYGTQEKVGKKKGGDIEQKKKTILIIKALERLSEIEGKELLTVLDSNQPLTEKLEKILPLLEKAGVKGEIENLIRQFSDDAFQHVHEIDADTHQKQPLITLATRLMERDH